jgi:hypothetical protein
MIGIGKQFEDDRQFSMTFNYSFRNNSVTFSGAVPAFALFGLSLFGTAKLTKKQPQVLRLAMLAQDDRFMLF